MDKSDIPFLTASELSRLIEKREVSPVEATEAYQERIERLDPKFHAYITLCPDEAIQAAREAERALAQGNHLGPMHGIPVAVKDQAWTKGIRTTVGSTILSDSAPDEDATIIAKLKSAGAVLLGKANQTEFAITAFTHRYSTPLNPWNPDYYAGGSSSGSCTATGAFLCATSLGEDTGGSIRMPANWCGLVGLRPSWGRVSRYGVMRGVWSMDALGPISRTVEDAAITLGAIAGYDLKDPYTWDSPVPDYRRSLTGDVRGLRVGVIMEPIKKGLVEPEVEDAFAKATSVLGEAGASVEEVSLPMTTTQARVVSRVLLYVEPAFIHRRWVRTRLDDYGHHNRIGLLTGTLIPAQAYYKAQKLMDLYRRHYLKVMAKYDVLVVPTAGRPAMKLEEIPSPEKRQPHPPMPWLLTSLFNVVGAPAISVPCGLTSEGLPIGLQIGGRPGEDEMVLRVAHAYEQRTPWHTMRPAAVNG